MRVSKVKVKVHNMVSSNGNAVPNQFIISTKDGRYFQSYDTIIAFINNSGKVFVDEDSWDFSRTTLKYLKQFLGWNTSATRKGIKNGQITLAKFN